MTPGDKPLLSILIPTLVRREAMFMKLLDELLPQCETSPQAVEVVGLQNQGERTLAEYREALLRDARGDWLCFIDDDDMIPGYYVDEIFGALAHDPDVVTFVQDGSGTAANLTLFGLQFAGAPWEPVRLQFGTGTVPVPGYLRVFSHVQPVRAEVARRATFLHPAAPGFTQEDQVFAQAVVPLLLARGSKERWIPKIMYTYRFMAAGESTQAGPQPVPGPHDRPVVGSPCFRWLDL